MNLIVGAVVLWFASKLFPDVVQVADIKTLIIAVILMAIVTLMIAAICFILIVTGFTTGSIAFICCGIFAALFSNVIALYVISEHLVGFNVVGFWPKVLIALCFSMFSVNITQTKNNKY